MTYLLHSQQRIRTVSDQDLLIRLLQRGDDVSIIKGQLEIEPSSGRAVPEEWFRNERDVLIKQVSVLMGLDPLVYDGYSTGRYGQKQRYSGVTLQFVRLLSGEQSYIVFNANLDRAKSTKFGKKGTPLPSGRFRIGRKSAFYKFWLSTGLNIPPRLSSFHDYMGNLKDLIFSAQNCVGEKLDKETIAPLSISCTQLVKTLESMPENMMQTLSVHQPHNHQTSLADNGYSKTRMQSVSKQVSTAGESNRATRLSGNADIRGNVIPFESGSKKPQDQTLDEWLADYCKSK